MIGVASINRLSAVKIFAAVGRTTTVISRWVVSPGLAVGVDHSKLPQVTTGKTDGSERFELGLNMTLPEIGWLHNMHVAVEHFESGFGHTAMPLRKLI
jgi:hypothetical protein